MNKYILIGFIVLSILSYSAYIFDSPFLWSFFNYSCSILCFLILQLIHEFICTLERQKLDALQLKIVKNAQILKLYVLNHNSVISVFVTVVK